MFPRVPGQSGYNKRFHSLTATMTWVCAALRQGSRVHDDTAWLAGRLHPYRVRPLPTHRDALSPGGKGPVRVLRLPLTLLLGPAPAPGVHHPRSSSGLGPDSRYLAQQPHSAPVLRSLTPYDHHPTPWTYSSSDSPVHRGGRLTRRAPADRGG